MDCESYREDMLDVLYGEASEPGLRRFESHQAACAECRQELAALRKLRGDLGHWRVREPLGVPAVPARTARGMWRPLAAAAAILVALGGLVAARADVRVDRSGLVVRLGAVEDNARADRERRRDEEIAALRAQVAALARPAPDEARLLEVVADMIRQSEERQEALQATRLSELRARADAQRQYDLARVSAGLAYLDGKAGLQAARTTELVGQLIQVSQQK